MPNSGTLVLPMPSAPAARSRSTSTLSSAGRRSRKIGEPSVWGKPTAGSRSLNAMGRPCSGTDRLAARQAPIGLVGEREAGLAGQLRDDRGEPRIQPLDPAQVRLHELARRHAPLADQPRQLDRTRIAQRFIHDGLP